jgi:hypothetical protein
MATHDYIISNASGASVRADLNNALAAIVSNNSNATSPATTYAYQWWADTTTGQLKLRNSANSAWITIFELDGTMLMEDGTVSAPGLAFASDLNTGFFRSAADKINFATGGAERLEIGSSEVVFNDPSNDVDFRVESNGQTHMLFVDAGNDRVGIGESSPDADLHVNSNTENLVARFESSDAGARIEFKDIHATSSIEQNSNEFIFNSDMSNADGNSRMSFKIDNSEAMRIDSSGRLMLGTTTEGHADADNFTIEDSGNCGITIRSGTSSNGSIYFSDDTSGVPEYGGFIDYNQTSRYMRFGTASAERVRIDSNGTTLITSNVAVSGSELGSRTLQLLDSGTDDAMIYGDNSGSLSIQGGASQPGSGVTFTGKSASSDPGTIKFFTTTTSNNLASFEVMRIDSSGRLLIGVASSYANANADDLQVGNNSSSTITGISLGSTVGSSIRFADAGNASAGIIEYVHASDAMRFYTGASERARLDSSGRLLVGTSSAITTYSLEVVQDSGSNLALVCGSNVGAANGPYQVFARSRGSTSSPSVVQDGDTTGVIEFRGYSGAASAYRTNAAIAAAIDGTPDSGGDTTDMPGRLVFSTTPDGASSPTERMRITSTGEVRMTLAGGDVFRFGGGTNHSIFRDGKCGIHWTTAALLPTNGSGTINDNVMDIGEISHRFDDIYATNGTIQTSDQTLKQDVAALTTAEIAVAKRIRGLVKTYRWIDSVEAKGDDARIHCGVIAQEVEQAFTAEGLDANRYALFCKDTWYEANGVSLTPDGPVTADDEGAVEVTRRGVRYPELLAFVMAGVNAEMADVTSRLAALEAA